MPMVRRFPEVHAFSAGVSSFLLLHEAANCLPLRIISSLISKPEPVPPDTYLAALMADTRSEAPVLGVAVRTPPHNLVLSSPFPAEGMDPLLADTAEFSLPGVIGPLNEAEAFAAAWRERTKGGTAVTMRLGVYALEQVRSVAAVAGKLRPAVLEENDLVQEWVRAFHAEAVPHSPVSTRPVELNGFHFWEVGGVPVTSVCALPSTPRGAVINAVYTPPAMRRRGYATAAVAAASALMLGQGRRFCFLFTDLANPTSNSIYQRIGYHFVGEFSQIGFTLAVGD